MFSPELSRLGASLDLRRCYGEARLCVARFEVTRRGLSLRASAAAPRVAAWVALGYNLGQPR